MNVKEAQVLREEEQALRSVVKDREAAWQQADNRADKIALRKEIVAAKERLGNIALLLVDAPAVPLTPEQIWLHITSVFSYQQDFESARLKFLEECSRNIGYTLEWQADSIVKAEKMAQLTNWVNKLVEIEDLTERVDKFYERLPIFIEQLQEEVLRGARSRISRSTNLSSNLVEDARLEATAELLDRQVNRSFAISRAKECFESWKELQAND